MIRKYFEFVRFSHTIFALPFALASMALAARADRGWPGWRVFGLVLAAMVCARTAAMGFNRIVDRKFDAQNPRTAQRHLPAGEISLCGAWSLVIGSAAGFVAATWFINWICFCLSPVALGIVFFYSVTKRFTSLSHVFLGVALAVAPVGAWLAVTGKFAWPPVILAAAVVLWLTGFDIIYATQDVEADRVLGLHSLPARFGVPGSLRIAGAAHAAMVAVLVVFGWVAELRWFYGAALALIAVCLAVEHRLARRQDVTSLNAAFFRMNAVVSVVLLVAVLAEVAFGGSTTARRFW